MNRKSRIIIGAILFGILVSSSVVASLNTSDIQATQAAYATTNENRNTDSTTNHATTTHIASSHIANSSTLPTDATTKLASALNSLWVDHIVWTRMYIVSYLADLPDTDVVAQRLLKNQENIGDAIKSFYGEEAGNKLTDLLKGHILVAVDLLKAAKAGDSSAVAEAEKQWYQNADDIATFLSNANPNWSKKSLTKMLHEHLTLTKAEAVARLTGNYTGDIATFDLIHQHANGMSDAIVDGIVKQFPEKFQE